MITLNCFTNGFAGERCTVPGKLAEQVNWTYYEPVWSGITIFEGAHITKVNECDSRFKVAWLCEGRCLRPEQYAAIQLIEAQFDRIITHDTRLAAMNPHKYRLMPRIGCRIPREHWGGDRYKPNKVVICVGKKCQTEGHRLRHAIASRFGGRTDIFYDYDRVEILGSYQYAIVVEACREGVMFSEHLLDTLAMGCRPIYYGTHQVGLYLKYNPVIPFDNFEDLAVILATLPARSAQTNGMNAARLAELAQYEIPEDWMVRNVLVDYVKELQP